MKILHCCLSCFYIDNYSYQENELIRSHLALGHSVRVVASTESYDSRQRKTYVTPDDYVGAEGARVTRIPFTNWLPAKVAQKVKAYRGLDRILKEFAPDAIMFHGISSLALITVTRFAKAHPNVILYADNHADKNNSARSFWSYNFLHAFFFKRLIRYCLPNIRKILCISAESIEFCRDVYQIPREHLEFYPLGGNIFETEEYERRRAAGRANLGVKDDEIMLLQTGKMNHKKKLLESLDAFMKTSDPRAHFVVAGSLDESIEHQATAKINKDSRIQYLGWQGHDDMKTLLCACDLYVQPGSQSATMQMALCARCPVILDDVTSHQAYVTPANGWLVTTPAELAQAIASALEEPNRLRIMSEHSLDIAQQLLDYEILAKRILS